MLYPFNLINFLFTALEFAILIRVILSWVRIDPYNPLVRLLDQITEPILAPIRRMIPPAAGLDFSPIIAFFALEVLRQIILGLLF
ncbi:MAG TPA: YggT family protein [Anaerolineae bacterium]|nr:YggT family protein [Caldilineae bacterium]HID33704.1 YggT family protein [Anaerolineae bacterium]